MPKDSQYICDELKLVCCDCKIAFIVTLPHVSSQMMNPKLSSRSRRLAYYMHSVLLCGTGRLKPISLAILLVA
jgi:hypothetical protein